MSDTHVMPIVIALRTLLVRVRVRVRYVGGSMIFTEHKKKKYAEKNNAAVLV